MNIYGVSVGMLPPADTERAERIDGLSNGSTGYARKKLRSCCAKIASEGSCCNVDLLSAVQ